MGNRCGDTAPPVYVISGLTKYKMPSDDFLVLRVEGMCVGGYGVGGSKEVGNVILMRNKKGMEKVRFSWVMKNVLIPFVEKLRKTYDKFDAAGGQIPEHLRAVFWSDGDQSLVDRLVSEEGMELLRKHGIIACKHNASRTGTEQAPDLARVFPISKCLNRSITVVHIPSDKHTLKDALEKGFADLRQTNGIRLRKFNILIEYLAKQPQILSRSHVPSNVIHGLVANGMLDPKHNRVPVFRNIIGTIRRVPNMKEYDLFKTTFNKLMTYSYCHDMRHIPDSEYIKVGFPANIDENGVE